MNQSALSVGVEFEASLGAEDLPAYIWALSRAKRVSLTFFGLKVTTEPGRHVRRKIAVALGRLPSAEIHSLRVGTHWLGSTTRGCLIAFLDLSPALMVRLKLSNTPFFSYQSWEDVAFYSDREALLWTCTHEGEGVVYGEAEQLARVGLSPQPAREPFFLSEAFDDRLTTELLHEMRQR